MADLPPPKLAADERSTVLALLQFQRDSVVRKVEGCTAAAAREALVPSGTSLLWLVKHLGVAERVWITHRFAGMEPMVAPATVDDSDSTEAAVAEYRATWEVVDAVVARSSLDDVCVGPPDDPLGVNLRWILMHLLEETARHAGHADILRELIDGSTGR